MRGLLTLTAVLEFDTGVALLVAPAFVANALLGATLPGPVALVVARLAGAALVALGAACWFARADAASRAARGLVVALTIYHVAAAALLAHARVGLALEGMLLWPAILGHAALALWSIASLRPGSRRA